MRDGRTKKVGYIDEPASKKSMIGPFVDQSTFLLKGREVNTSMLLSEHMLNFVVSNSTHLLN